MEDFNKESHTALIKKLVDRKLLETKKIIDAFTNTPREGFVRTEDKDKAYEDIALSIGHGVTISQPSTVAFLVEKLDTQSEHKVLEIGFGSGWLTTILSRIIGENGKVIAFEIVPEIYEFGKANIDKLNLRNVILKLGDASIGDKEHAPYDRIISSAAFERIPGELKEQLVLGGKLVAPTQKFDIRVLRRISVVHFDEEIYPGFAFVPILHTNNHQQNNNQLSEISR